MVVKSPLNVSLIISPDLPPGYPYQSITAPFGSPFPSYHIPASTGANTEVVPLRRSRSPPSASSLPSAHLHPRLLDADIKPQKLELSKTGSFLKREPGVEQTCEALGPLRRSCSPVGGSQERAEALRPQPIPLLVPSPPPQDERLQRVEEEGKEGDQIKQEVSSYSCQAACPPPSLLKEAEPKQEVIKDPDRTQFSSGITLASDGQESVQMCASLEQTTGAVCEAERPDSPSQEDRVTESPSSPPPPLICPEDPMAGMFALLTASEMAGEARPSTPPAPTLEPQIEDSSVAADCSGLEMVALEGMALLSQMVQSDVEHISKEDGQ